MPRFYDPLREILIDGQNIADVTKSSLRHHLAYVSQQQPYLFEGTIRDNIRYGRPEATDEEIEEAARLANAHEFILAQPMGYDNPRWRKRADAVRRPKTAAVDCTRSGANAPILLLDEATSALDTESEAAVQQALEAAMVGDRDCHRSPAFNHHQG